MDSFDLVIFGITGNLAQIKLIPVLYDMVEKDILPESVQIVGTARSPMTQEEFESYFHKVLHQDNRHHKHDVHEAVLKKLFSKLHYLPGNLDDPSFYRNIKDYLKKIHKGEGKQNLVFYLATYPQLYQSIFDNLKKIGLSDQEKRWVRLIIEKPIGLDLPSAKKLNKLLLKYFHENQIFRLDHYLGKETLQNILTFRFGNGIFEPMMNKKYIDHIQVSALEDFGIGKRGGYYDSVGALKDVGQNHLLQMLTIPCMDPPKEFLHTEVVKERQKIIKKLISYPKSLILGQYEGYQKEENVAPDSVTDTYFAFKTEINNTRFKGVPIYIRGGKSLKQTATEISIVFKNPTNRLFKNLDGGKAPNVLVYRIQPNEGIMLQILTKKPDHGTALNHSFMQYCYPQNFPQHTFPDAYEKLIVDAIRGDQTYFNNAAEVESEWKYIDEFTAKLPEPCLYKPGSWGPKEADELIEKDGRKWLEPSNQLCSFTTISSLK
ncbi:MAG: glucose-6-phosphate dehydrogenase [Candidatus Daviesbacteria bacterium]|nr:glucose-6-phosphate dehydrogenase [Candidatus Daviesbacteria bacterium]